MTSRSQPLPCNSHARRASASSPPPKARSRRWPTRSASGWRPWPAQTGNAREMQENRDDFLAFQAQGRSWVPLSQTAWRKALASSAGRRIAPSNSLSRLELIGDEVVENKHPVLAPGAGDPGQGQLRAQRPAPAHPASRRHDRARREGHAQARGAGQGAGRPVAGRRPEPRALDQGAGRGAAATGRRDRQGLQGRQCLPDRARA